MYVCMSVCLFVWVLSSSPSSSPFPTTRQDETDGLSHITQAQKHRPEKPEKLFSDLILQEKSINLKIIMKDKLKIEI